MTPCILIVDDDPAVYRVLGKALRAYSVTYAENGRAGLRRIEEKQPDLVISDINMPEMDGLALLKQLRIRYPGLPVLGMSGYVDPKEAHNYGFDGFIGKPFDLDEVERLVGAHLKQAH